MKLGDLFRPMDVHEVIYQQTGYRVEWLSDGGNDGTVRWSFHRYEVGWVDCLACMYSVATEPGWSKLPSPYRRCPHMLKVGL